MTELRPIRGLREALSPPGAGRALRAGVALASAVLLAQTASAESIRCDGALVEVGDPKVRLLAECGEPLSRDVVAVVKVLADGEEIRSSYAETWSYETGAREYRVLRFEGGKLVGDGMRCGRDLVEAGDTTLAVLQNCGEPVSREAAGRVNDPPQPAARNVVSESLVEHWTYSQGPGKFSQIVVLREGRIEAIENGSRE